VELRDTISGSRGGNVLVASAGGIVRSESSVSVSIRITISVRVAIGTSVQVCGISFSFGFSSTLVEGVGSKLGALFVDNLFASLLVGDFCADNIFSFADGFGTRST
jgi:hypothetical protein